MALGGAHVCARDVHSFHFSQRCAPLNVLNDGSLLHSSVAPSLWSCWMFRSLLSLYLPSSASSRFLRRTYNGSSTPMSCSLVDCSCSQGVPLTSSGVVASSSVDCSSLRSRPWAVV